MITRCRKERSWIFEKATLGMLVLQCFILLQAKQTFFVIFCIPVGPPQVSAPPFGGGLGLSFGISFYLTRSVRTAFSSHKKEVPIL